MNVKRNSTNYAIKWRSREWPEDSESTKNERKKENDTKDSALLKHLKGMQNKKFENVDKRIASLDTKLAKVEKERATIKEDLNKSFSTAVKQNLMRVF